MTGPARNTYALKSMALSDRAAPDLPYLPPVARHDRPRMGVIGAGGIVAAHLDAYRSAGLELRAWPDLQRTWFNDGFHGALGALLVAIEDNTKHVNGAAENLRKLAVAFAALQSRRLRREVAIGEATRIEMV